MTDSPTRGRIPANLPYQEIVEQAGDAIFVADATGRFTAANRRALDLLGYDEDELFTKRVFDLHPPEDLQAAPLQLAMLDGGKPVVAERRLVRKNGAVIEAELSARRLPDGSMFSIVRDMTERKKVLQALREGEERLRASETYYRTILENVSDLIMIVGPDFVTRFATSSSRRVLGFEPEYIVGKPATDFIHPDDLGEIAEKWVRVLAAPAASETSEIRVRRHDGSWCNMVATALNLIADPAVNGILVNSRDITARVRAENDLRERTDELERLNQFMVDRELRMIELKRELAALKKAAGSQVDP